jgi:hypothetical protein
MVEITEATSIEELAVIISEALEAAGITATLSVVVLLASR